MNIPKDKCTWLERSRTFVIEASDVGLKPGQIEMNVVLIGTNNTSFRFRKNDMNGDEVAGWKYVQDPPYAGNPINLLIIND